MTFWCTKSFAPKAFNEKEKKASKKANKFSCEPYGEANASSSFSTVPTAVSRKSFSEVDSSALLNSSDFRDFLSPLSDVFEFQSFRVFASTWNVGGNMPHTGLFLNDFLPLDDGSDIYVLGFQEIVPLNAGNVLVMEDKEPPMKWIHLIDQALNNPVKVTVDSRPSPPSYQTPASNGLALFQKSIFSSTSKTFRTVRERRLKACNCLLDVKRNSYRRTCFTFHHSYDSDDDTVLSEDVEEEECYFDVNEAAKHRKRSSSSCRYICIVDKKMVGLFITIWAKREIVQHISHLQISCISCGIMGRLGNKGCISVSLSLHQTSFCFICSHLTSGEKEGDERRRNSDVMEILKGTTFRRICKNPHQRTPKKIIDHDRVIWLGDLNYRIALSYLETRRLLVQNDWAALLENDQLRIEREAGRVFKGWKEGKIYFAPTYKYSNDSDSYSGENVACKSKRRTPAWCDRILWHGNGISQLFYIRGESKLSDHRPVFAVFSVRAKVRHDNFGNEQLAINMKVGEEELMPLV